MKNKILASIITTLSIIFGLFYLASCGKTAEGQKDTIVIKNFTYGFYTDELGSIPIENSTMESGKHYFLIYEFDEDPDGTISAQGEISAFLINNDKDSVDYTEHDNNASESQTHVSRNDKYNFSSVDYDFRIGKGRKTKHLKGIIRLTATRDTTTPLEYFEMSIHSDDFNIIYGEGCEEDTFFTKYEDNYIAKKTYYTLNEDRESYSIARIADWLKEYHVHKIYHGLPVTAVADEAFMPATELEIADLPDTITKIGNYAFSGLKQLKTISCPPKLESIGNYAFQDCMLMPDLSFPDTLLTIGNYAFKNCAGFRDVTIPDSVTSIGEYCMAGCSSLAKLQVPYIGDRLATSEEYTFGYFFGKENYQGSYQAKQMRIKGTNTYEFETYYIPALLTDVTVTLENAPKGAFYNCSKIFKIKLLTVPNKINEYVFYGCSSLQSFDIPQTVTVIGENAFRGCSSLTNMVIPSNVIRLDDYVFYQCTSLSSIELPNSITSIGAYAFSFCESLTSIEIPELVTEIKPFTYSYCSKLEEINITPAITKIGEAAYEECSSIKTLSIPTTVKSIDKYVFRNDIGLTNVVIPDSIESIGEAVFNGCVSLKEITIPFIGEKLTAAENENKYPFGYIFGKDGYNEGIACKQSYKNSLNSISSNNYYIPVSLTKVTLTGGIVPLGAFQNCVTLKEINLPNVTILNDYAFYGCEGLDSFTIPATVETIGANCFYGCKNLTSITIPTSVKTIGALCFNICESLTTILFEDASSTWSITNTKDVEIASVTVASGSANVTAFTETYRNNKWTKK